MILIKCIMLYPCLVCYLRINHNVLTKNGWPGVLVNTSKIRIKDNGFFIDWLKWVWVILYVKNIIIINKLFLTAGISSIVSKCGSETVSFLYVNLGLLDRFAVYSDCNAFIVEYYCSYFSRYLFSTASIYQENESSICTLFLSKRCISVWADIVFW